MRTTATNDLETFIEQVMKWDSDAMVYGATDMVVTLSDGPFKKGVDFQVANYKAAAEKITEFRDALQCEFRVEIVAKIRIVADIDARPEVVSENRST